MIVKWSSVSRLLILSGLGLVIGIAFGLLVGWVAWPLEFTEADPTILEESYQRDYTLMIASAYWLDDDLTLARQRLNSLGKEDAGQWLLAVTVDTILEQGDETQIRHLVKLAADLGLSSPAMDPYLPTPEPEGE